MSGSDLEIVRALVESADDFLAQRHAPSRCKGAGGVAKVLERPFWRDLAQLGWIGLTLPEGQGGSGLDLGAAAALCEAFGRWAVPDPLIASAIMPAAILGGAPGQDAQMRDHLTSILLAGESTLSVAWQEKTPQIGVEAPAASVRNARLTGNKVFVPAAEDDTTLLVWAQREGTPVVVAVDARADGVAVLRQAAGLGHASTIRFDESPILRGTPLVEGRPAEDALRGALQHATVCAAAQLAGLAAGALQKTVDYVSGRVQFNRAIGSFQSIQHRCADLYIAVQLAGATFREAARTCAPSAVAAAKARCGDTALQVARDAVQMHGAMGFTEEADIGLYLRSALHLSSWLGTPTLQRRAFMAARAVEPENADG